MSSANPLLGNIAKAAIDAAMASTDAAVKALSDSVRVPMDSARGDIVRLAEEVDMLWWCIGDWHELLDKPRTETAAGLRMVVSGIELGAMVRKLPGPYGAHGIREGSRERRPTPSLASRLQSSRFPRKTRGSWQSIFPPSRSRCCPFTRRSGQSRSSGRPPGKENSRRSCPTSHPRRCRLSNLAFKRSASASARTWRHYLMNTAAPICSYNGCKVQVDGKCALGRDPVESCENYAADVGPTEELDEPEEPRTVPPVEIWASNKMLLADYSALSRRRRLRTVALVGEEKVGKTTLLCSIYAMFCKGPFADLTFAGSETLLGFAKLHAFAMLNSGRLSPTVPRTSRRDPLAFFHLALARSRRDVVDLVIADRSGETYAAARTSTDLIGTLDEFRLADRVCFLLDGGRLRI